ncbi:MAG: HpaII family restriction endonuclease [Clostridia bacterium]|nr:HpaII family restriction endonuclease [Clostridia bacterium]
MAKYKSIDLFAGIGGIRLGFDKAFGKDIETVFVSEWDEKAQETYKTNFNDSFEIAGDITVFDESLIPDFDICLAGFPCQAFSIAGKKQGFEDDYKGTCRGTLFLDVARICEYHKPKVIFCENVKGLYIHDKGRTFEIICKTFESLGYKVFHKILNSKDFGVPQNRERVYIVAFRNDIAPEKFDFPIGTDDTKRIYNIIEDAPVPAKYYLSETYMNTLVAHKKRHAAKGNGFGYEIRSLGDVAGAIVCGGMGRERNLIIDNRQKELIPTTHIKGSINKDYVRKMTPREWARLQGFPDSFVLPLADTHMYKQFGNSVTVNVIEAIAKKIREVLEFSQKMIDTKEQPKMPNNTAIPTLSGNKGEWSEIYIFLKLMCDGKVHAADMNMNRLADVFLNIIKIIREEYQNQKYEYITGPTIKIFLNAAESGPELSVERYKNAKDVLWETISRSTRGNGITCEPIDEFLNEIHITKLKAPAVQQSEFFGGTQDITMQVQDYRNGIASIIGFSCKSDFTAKSTLFNASKDNTNFVYRIEGNINDALMNEFNNAYSYRNKRNKETGVMEPHAVVAIRDRIVLLKNAGCDIVYDDMAKTSAKRNLILSGGNEMPLVVANMLKAYYFEGEGLAANSSIEYALNYVIQNNSANYEFTDIDSMYRRKVGTLLYDMFTGMRLSNPWDGRSSVNGGYIVAKDDGDVVAYHSCMADEFKDFLIHQLGFESPSATRHQYMSVYKDGDNYYLKLNLQVRFKGVSTEE